MSVLFNQLNNSFNQNVAFSDPVLSGPITIAAGGVESEANGQTGMVLLGGAYALTVNGLLTATSSSLGGRGLELGVAAASTPNQVSNLTVGATGEISGVATAITAFHATNISNTGLIQGGAGIYVAGNAVAYEIRNSGDIIADTGAAIWADGSGAHTIFNTGFIQGRVEGSFVANSIETITNAGTIDGQILARGGDDVIVNSGTIEGAIFLEGGNDSLTNTGVIFGDIIGGSSSDTIQNDGTVNGSIFGGTSVDTLGNTGTINGNVNAESNNDVFTNTGLVTGWIFMGTGNDTFTGGAFAENIADERGTDSYVLGDGFDNFDAVGIESATGDDVINAGADTGSNPSLGLYGDTYNASDAAQAVFINLSSLAQVDSVSGLSYAASQARGIETGNDTITGFEAVYSGGGNDVVLGNARNNFVSGGTGNDHVFGGTGDDYVDGGQGADFISGGSGKDFLDASADAVRDTFVYSSRSDSTAGATGRDTIDNFTDLDRIDLSRLNIASLHFIGADTSFDATTGAVRVLTTQAGWLIELDSNGNRLADFSISVLDADHNAVPNWSDNFLF